MDKSLSRHRKISNVNYKIQIKRKTLCVHANRTVRGKLRGHKNISISESKA